MPVDDQTLMNTPNTTAPPSALTKHNVSLHTHATSGASTVGVTASPAASTTTASEYRGHTLMEERHRTPPQSAHGEASDTSSTRGALGPFDEASMANRPHLPVAIRTPARTDLPVRVACHRGDWRNYVENTIEAVESCIRMGADIVEVDVWRTKDGVLVLNHDETLARTTDLKGKVSEYNYEELKGITLKDGLSNMTEFKLATVEELLVHTGNRIFVNLDKADLYLKEAYDILRRTDLVRQVILKSETSYEEMCGIWGVELMNEIIFMPIFNVKKETTAADIQKLFDGKHDVYEINFENENGNEEKLALIKQCAERDNAVLWINTIWPSTCGGHSDDRAIQRNTDSNWGYIVDKIGAGILQTDRPAILLEYLSKHEWR